MTVALGFICSDGLVICADSQETVGDYLKRSEQKVIIYPPVSEATSKLRVVVAGAGEDSFFIELEAEKLWSDLANLGSDSMVEVRQQVQRTIVELHREYAPAYARNTVPDTSLLIGLCVAGKFDLMKTRGPVAIKAKTHECIGFGESLGAYLIEQVKKQQNDLTLFGALIAGAYILERVKEYVQYCGNESHIFVIRPDGSIVQLNKEQVRLLSEGFELALSFLQGLTTQVAAGTPDEKRGQRLKQLLEIVESVSKSISKDSKAGDTNVQ